MKTLLIATLLALGGCAASYFEPTLSADHPASPTAEEAPPPTRWHTLDLATADQVAPAEAKPGMDHAGHGVGAKDESPPREHGADGDGHKHDGSTPTAAPKSDEGAAAATIYACPMHPEITSDKPDQRCPKCGMKLVKKNGGKQP